MAEITLFIPQEKLDRWRAAARQAGHRKVTDWAESTLDSASQPPEPDQTIGEPQDNYRVNTDAGTIR